MASQQLVDKRRLSHAYILSAPTREKRAEMARRLASAVLCGTAGTVACGKCKDCRKVEQGIHPDLITIRPPVDDKGKEKAEILVDQVRQLVMDSHILPVESERKIYIIEEAEKMRIESQNAALKLLEEPPCRLVLALCTSNPNGLLPTVRSRCVEVSEAQQAFSTDDEIMKWAEKYLRLAAAGNKWELFSFCAEHEDMDSSSARIFMQAVQSCAVDMLAKRRDSYGISPRKLMDLCRLAEKCRDYLKVNTGVKHIFGLLAVAASADEG